MNTSLIICIFLVTIGLLNGSHVYHGLRNKRTLNTILSRIAFIEGNNDIGNLFNDGNQFQNEYNDAANILSQYRRTISNNIINSKVNG
ncbi:hypothetical protein I4U23_006227 [Adineta vaga]|nr:hypothetical protein I4U23_006227 [Adineta vaga]